MKLLRAVIRRWRNRRQYSHLKEAPILAALSLGGFMSFACIYFSNALMRALPLYFHAMDADPSLLHAAPSTAVLSLAGLVCYLCGLVAKECHEAVQTRLFGENPR